MKLKRYLIFSGDEYYPNGGFNDFHGSFDDLQDAKINVKSIMEKFRYDWYHILDSHTCVIVDELLYDDD